MKRAVVETDPRAADKVSGAELGTVWRGEGRHTPQIQHFQYSQITVLEIVSFSLAFFSTLDFENLECFQGAVYFWSQCSLSMPMPLKISIPIRFVEQ